ncbi:arginase family protein [Lactobacillus sp. PSON]|uniref:arginase family protein n=1 Tax=Lactobacillus sp. PSON TaxID=3455454 RepID=UPI0040428C99
MSKTIRLEIPDWQAGNNPVYKLGSQILSVIAPNNNNQKEIKIPVPDTPQKLTKENGIYGKSIIKQTMLKTYQVIKKEKPDKIITFGGNCLVSQAPIDYLNDHYNNLGVIWFDAHPDISNPKMFYNEHAMVLGNLLKHGDPELAQLITHPLTSKQIYYAGLQSPTIQEKRELDKLAINYSIQKNTILDLNLILDWIKKNDFDGIYIHLDMDVMNPHTFYATYFNNPELSVIPDNAATGIIKRQSVWSTISELSKKANLVGFTMAEFLPWSAKQLQDLMKNTTIFNN